MHFVPRVLEVRFDYPTLAPMTMDSIDPVAALKHFEHRINVDRNRDLQALKESGLSQHVWTAEELVVAAMAEPKPIPASPACAMHASVDEVVSGSRLVMVVNDDADVRECIAAVLTEEGCDVRTVADGIEAMRMLKTVRPRLILLDWLMPRMGGKQVLDALKADEALAAIPVIVLATSRPHDADLRGARCLVQPIDLETIIDASQKHYDLAT